MLHILFTVISHLTIIFVITSYHFLDETVKLLDGKVVHASRRQGWGEELRPSQSPSWQNSLVLCSTGTGVLNNLGEGAGFEKDPFFPGQVLDAMVPGLGHDLELNAF